MRWYRSSGSSGARPGAGQRGGRGGAARGAARLARRTRHQQDAPARPRPAPAGAGGRGGRPAHSHTVRSSKVGQPPASGGPRATCCCGSEGRAWQSHEGRVLRAWRAFVLCGPERRCRHCASPPAHTHGQHAALLAGCWQQLAALAQHARMRLALLRRALNMKSLCAASEQPAAACDMGGGLVATACAGASPWPLRMRRILEPVTDLTCRQSGPGAGAVREGADVSSSRRRFERVCGAELLAK